MTSYTGISELNLATDNQSWESAQKPIFAELIEAIKPKHIIEVGSWKGVSAMKMAVLGMPHGTHIHCVDTWLGSCEHFLGGDALPRDKWGYPRLFHQFLTNVQAAGLQDFITPYPMCSNDGARYLKHLGVTAKMAYIDGDHSHEGCYNDCVHYWPLVEPGGVMFGDDMEVFSSVKSAVVRFAGERDLPCMTHDGFWMFKKG